MDVLVAGLGTGGTICGAGRYLKEMKPGVQLVAIEPEEAPYFSQGVFHPHRLMDTAPGFVPRNAGPRDHRRDLFGERGPGL